MATALGIALVTGGVFGVQGWQAGLINVQQELDRFVAVEAKAIGDFNAAVEKAGKGELSDKSFANLLEQDVLPEWRAQRERLSALKNAPPRLQRRVDSIVRYMSCRSKFQSGSSSHY